MRGGTENVYGIIGMAKALSLSISNINNHRNKILSVKKHMIEMLTKKVKGVQFNGHSNNSSTYLHDSITLFLSKKFNIGFLL